MRHDDMVKYFVWIPRSLRDTLNREARRRLISTSALVRMILAQGVGYNQSSDVEGK